MDAAPALQIAIIIGTIDIDLHGNCVGSGTFIALFDLTSDLEVKSSVWRIYVYAIT